MFNLAAVSNTSEQCPEKSRILATKRKVELASFLFMSTNTLSAGCLAGWIDGPEQVRDSSLACRNVVRWVGCFFVLHW